ncbi:unnamed protein product [Adineta steineri]|uniref:Transmembrane protein n=1 Tax=Adineta steineri TaxID=433720 RepID=A0A813PMA3_9BILA|nr:unnamed protein product [Adineta steineri]
MVVPSRAYKSDIIKRCLPNHHSLGELLLPCFLRQLFTLTVLFTLLCFLVSYALAGSQAFATLFRVPYVTMIPVFCWTWAFVIIFLHAFIQPIISVFTLLKALLFTGTVVVTLLVGLKIRNPVHDDYSAMGDSFLMSTIALGGLMNVMPLMFSKIKQTREEIIGFNTALFLGLTTCVILNILWCWSILAIVPQESTCLSSSINDTIQMAVNLLNESQTQGHCVLSSSLAKAQSDGEISTVPLSKILDNGDYHYFKYVSFIVQLFIVTSISVSFLTMGSALHHTIKGVVDAYWNPTLEAETNLRKYGNAFEYITVRRIIQWIFSIIIFALVFGIAMSNPKGFITILEEAASLFQNIEIGLFLAIMTYKVTSHEYSKYTLPFQLPRCSSNYSKTVSSSSKSHENSHLISPRICTSVLSAAYTEINTIWFKEKWLTYSDNHKETFLILDSDRTKYLTVQTAINQKSFINNKLPLICRPECLLIRTQSNNKSLVLPNSTILLEQLFDRKNRSDAKRFQGKLSAIICESNEINSKLMFYKDSIRNHWYVFFNDPTPLSQSYSNMLSNEEQDQLESISEDNLNYSSQLHFPLNALHNHPVTYVYIVKNLNDNY